MRRIRDPLGYPILREGQILRVKLNLCSNARGLSRPAGPAVIRWTEAASETGTCPGREAAAQPFRPTPGHAGIRNHSSGAARQVKGAAGVGRALHPWAARRRPALDAIAWLPQVLTAGGR